MSDPRYWWSLFPQGTEEGDEESRFFCAIARNVNKWSSIPYLANESKLSESRIEEIIAKYAPIGVLLQNTKDPDEWGYWERVGSKKADKNILQEEHDTRFKKLK